MSAEDQQRKAIEEMKALRTRQRPLILLWGIVAGIAANLIIFGIILFFSLLLYRFLISSLMLAAGLLLLALAIRAIRFHNIKLASRAREFGFEIKRSTFGRYFARHVRSQAEEEVDFLIAVGGCLFCRACCTRIDADVSAAICAGCQKAYHTVCLQEPGLCPYCAENSEVPEEIDEYCECQEWEAFRELDPPLLANANPETVVPLEKENLLGRFYDLKSGHSIVPEMPPEHYAEHGWPIEDLHKRKAGCGIACFLWIPFILAITHDWDGLGEMLILFATSYVAYLLLAAIGDWIRGMMWPLKEPSPGKRRLIAWRTWFFGTACVLYVVMLAGMAFESQLSPWFYHQVTYLGLLCGMAGVAALALGFISLAVE